MVSAIVLYLMTVSSSRRRQPERLRLRRVALCCRSGFSPVTSSRPAGKRMIEFRMVQSAANGRPTVENTRRKDTIVVDLHKLLGSVPPSERRVARTLLDGYPASGLGTLAELAGRSRVSSPTVLRLLSRLGFSTFGDFQRELRSDVEARLATTASLLPFDTPAPGEHIVQKLLLESAENIGADARSLVPEEIDAVVELIAVRSRNVVIMGAWLSHAFAMYFYRQLHLLRPGCHYVGSSVSFDGGELTDLGRRDTLVVFDVRPYTPALREMCRTVRSQGARIVLFTDAWLSPIAQHSSHVLVSRTACSSPLEAMASICALADGLLAAILLRLGPDAERRAGRVEAFLDGWGWQPGGFSADSSDHRHGKGPLGSYTD